MMLFASEQPGVAEVFLDSLSLRVFFVCKRAYPNTVRWAGRLSRSPGNQALTKY